MAMCRRISKVTLFILLIGFYIMFGKKKKKIEISGPSNFEHRVHTGFDPQEQKFTGLPQQWHSLLADTANRPKPMVDPSCITPIQLAPMKEDDENENYNPKHRTLYYNIKQVQTAMDTFVHLWTCETRVICFQHLPNTMVKQAHKNSDSRSSFCFRHAVCQRWMSTTTYRPLSVVVVPLPGKATAAVIFLHGLGDTGTDGQKPLQFEFLKNMQRFHLVAQSSITALHLALKRSIAPPIVNTYAAMLVASGKGAAIGQFDLLRLSGPIFR
ncbi:hypothetical protein STEG23_016257 [Scotinomys teguina]